MNEIKIIIRMMPPLIIFSVFPFMSSCKDPSVGISNEGSTRQDALIDLSFRPGSNGRNSNILNKLKEHLNVFGVAEFIIQEDPNSGILKISGDSSQIDSIRKFMAEMGYEEI